jgi:hypothetical protein
VRFEGKHGLIYDEAAEAKAFNRWQMGQFHDLEREFASQWRAALKAARHADMAKLAKAVLRIEGSPRNLREALHIAKEVVTGNGQHFLNLKTAYSLLGLPQELWIPIRKRWKEAGSPPLATYAPYTAHCLTVDTFFHVAVDKKLISPDRPSNRIDVAYLYYLPFCMIFVSNDGLHKRTVPLLTSHEQVFVSGEELKRDLAALDGYFSNLSEEEKAQGLFRLAAYPPNDDTFLTTRLWKQMQFKVERAEPAIPTDAVPVKELLARVESLKTQAQRQAPGSYDPREFYDPQHIVIERRIPLQMGKWRTMPPTVKPDSR